MKKDDSNNMFNEPVEYWAIKKMLEPFGEEYYTTVASGQTLQEAVCIYAEDSCYDNLCGEPYSTSLENFFDEGVELIVDAYRLTDERRFDRNYKIYYNVTEKIGRKKVRIKFSMEAIEVIL